MMKMAKNKFHEFRERLKQCRLCRDMIGFEPKPVVWGTPEAKIVQISQAPSKTVHETGKPFNDLSGAKLREWYGIHEDIFYNQKLFYMTDIYHCYLGKDIKRGDAKPPLNCAKKWLHEELSLIDNEIYLIIGRVPTNFLFPKKNFNELIFNDQTFNGKSAYVLPHPSPQNIKWFKDHPEFYDRVLPKIKGIVHEVIYKK